MKITEPVIHKIQDNIEELKSFEKYLLSLKDEKTKDIIMNFPVVYIHNWKSGDEYEVYVGESNNIFQRTRQHFDKISDANVWQSSLNNSASLYVIGHEHFNKSMALDIENKLIHYLMCVESVKKIKNLRGNPQGLYYPIEELDIIFSKIWEGLKKYNKKLFPVESLIRDSAIFKASPLHKLTVEQQEAKEKIIEKVNTALQKNEKGQLIFIEGEAGTGKTVLNSSTFYELLCQNKELEYDDNGSIKNQIINCCLVVNHDEQMTVYNQIVNKLGITDKYGEVVYKPTRFINTHSKNNLVDVVFIDEAHLLLTQGKQSYQGNNQLEDILNMAKVVIVMFDKNQILTTEQYWEDEQLDKYRNEAIKNNNYIRLENQLRIHANEDVMKWLDAFTKDGMLKKIPDNLNNYDIKIFDTPEKLDQAIKYKANKEKTKLSRLVATYDWKYNANKDFNKKLFKYWEVKIGKWHKPWNRELEQDLNRNQKKYIKGLSWAEQSQTIDEVGSTFTIQGFDLNYVGVIIGPSVKYRNGQVIFYPNESCNKKATRNRTMTNGEMKKIGEKLLKNELRVLMTRGVNGLYIYACDEELRKKLKECSQKDIQYKVNELEKEQLKVAEDEEYKYQ